jgi:hypothetical protein
MWPVHKKRPRHEAGVGMSHGWNFFYGVIVPFSETPE